MLIFLYRRKLLVPFKVTAPCDGDERVDMSDTDEWSEKFGVDGSCGDGVMSNCAKSVEASVFGDDERSGDGNRSVDCDRTGDAECSGDGNTNKCSNSEIHLGGNGSIIDVSGVVCSSSAAILTT